MKRVSLGNHSMIVLGTVQGLVKEKLKVRTAFNDIQPTIVGLPISDEMLEGLEAVVNGEVRESRHVKAKEDRGRWSLNVDRSSWAWRNSSLARR